jgi:FkbM family methyltransferase
MKINQNFNDWFSSRGDETVMLDHIIDQNSHVVEIGGFKGVWVSQIVDRYNPYIHIFEPVQEYYEFLSKKFKDNPKIKIYKLGISNKKEKVNISLIDDGSSLISTSNKFEVIDLIPFDEMIKMLNLKTIDLIQINIEGSEYDLLDFAITKNCLKNIQKILIQFHTNVDDCENRRITIQSNLEKLGFSKLFDYPFIWEGWVNN